MSLVLFCTFYYFDCLVDSIRLPALVMVMCSDVSSCQVIG